MTVRTETEILSEVAEHRPFRRLFCHPGGLGAQVRAQGVSLSALGVSASVAGYADLATPDTHAAVGVRAVSAPRYPELARRVAPR